MTGRAAAQARSAQEDEYARIGAPIVADVASRLWHQLGGVIDQSDLESLGNEALVKQIRRYDPASSPLAAYLRRYLRWAMLDKIRLGGEQLLTRARGLSGLHALREIDEEPAPASEPAACEQLGRALSLRATALALPLIARGKERPGAEETADSPSGRDAIADSSRALDQLVHRKSARRALVAALGRIGDEIARDVVVRHYFGDEPFERIAAELALRNYQVCRLHKKALAELELGLKAAGFDGPKL